MHNLEYVVAIAETGNLLRASERLFVSPSALSQAVARLEDELHLKLFTRSRNGWRPTEVGSIYIDMAKNILEERKRAYTQISMISSTFASTITIGISPGQTSDVFAVIFPLFVTRFPNIKIRLVEYKVQDIISGIKERRIDIGFVTSAFPFRDIQTQELYYEPFVIVVPRLKLPPNLPDINAQPPYPPVPLSRFKDMEFMLMEPETTLRSATDELFRQAGFAPNVAFESSTARTLHTLARNGYATAILPSTYTISSHEAVSFYLDTPLTWRRYAGCHSDRKLSLPEEYIISLANDYYRNLF